MDINIVSKYIRGKLNRLYPFGFTRGRYRSSRLL